LLDAAPATESSLRLLLLGFQMLLL